jgi:hypothetical protein
MLGVETLILNNSWAATSFMFQPVEEKTYDLEESSSINKTLSTGRTPIKCTVPRNCDTDGIYLNFDFQTRKQDEAESTVDDVRGLLKSHSHPITTTGIFPTNLSLFCTTASFKYGAAISTQRRGIVRESLR